jgi:hypothetical protein
MTNEQRIASLEKNAKTAEMMIDLRSHPVMAPIFERFRGDVEAINYRLLNAEMDATSRTIMMEKRNFIERFVGMFVGAEITLENSKKALEKLL